MEAIHTDVLASILYHLDFRDLHIAARTSRKFSISSTKVLQQKKEESRRRFISETQNETDVNKITFAAVREKQFDFRDWDNFVAFNRIKQIMQCNKLPLSYFVYHMVYFMVWDKTWKVSLDLPFSQEFHNFILEYGASEWDLVSFLCFHATTTKYTKAARKYAKAFLTKRLQEVKNVYQFDIVSRVRRYCPDVYYEMLPSLELTERHWSALCVTDVRREVGPTKYFKIHQTVVDYYQSHLVSPFARKWVKRKLQAYKLTFPW